MSNIFRRMIGRSTPEINNSIKAIYDSFGGAIPKIFKGYAQQTGTGTPTVTTHINTIGEFVVARVGVGQYTLTFADNTFPDLYKIFFPSGGGSRIQTMFGDSVASQKMFKVFVIDHKTLAIILSDTAGAQYEMSGTFDGEDYAALPINFEVYP